MPITTVDGRPVGDGSGGPLTRRLMALFEAYFETTLVTPQVRGCSWLFAAPPAGHYTQRTAPHHARLPHLLPGHALAGLLAGDPGVPVRLRPGQDPDRLARLRPQPRSRDYPATITNDGTFRDGDGPTTLRSSVSWLPSSQPGDCRARAFGAPGSRARGLGGCRRGRYRRHGCRPGAQQPGCAHLSMRCR